MGWPLTIVAGVAWALALALLARRRARKPASPSDGLPAGLADPEGGQNPATGKARRKFGRSARLGPVLFILSGALAAYLGYWLPMRVAALFPSDTDIRIGFVINGFAPLTTTCAILAAHGYARLWRIQGESPTPTGRGLLVLLALPVIATSYVGICLFEPAVLLLPMFVRSLCDWVAGSLAGR
jgi:hypothetical protein